MNKKYRRYVDRIWHEESYSCLVMFGVALVPTCGRTRPAGSCSYVPVCWIEFPGSEVAKSRRFEALPISEGAVLSQLA